MVESYPVRRAASFALRTFGVHVEELNGQQYRADTESAVDVLERRLRDGVSATESQRCLSAISKLTGEQESQLEPLAEPAAPSPPPAVVAATPEPAPEPALPEIEPLPTAPPHSPATVPEPEPHSGNTRVFALITLVIFTLAVVALLAKYKRRV